jgi:pilus assembly protein CpaE
VSKDTAVRFLVLASDPSLEEEFDGALDGIKGVRCVAHACDHPQSLLDAARMRQPDVVVLEMGESTAELRPLCDEILMVAPDATIVAAYRPQSFVDAERESRAIIEALRARVSDFLRRPVSSGDLGALVDRLRSGRTRSRRPAEYGRVISFVSNKGGVGKSSVSANVACALAQQHPDEVLLLDLSLQLGVCASMLDLDATQTIADAAEQLDRLDVTLLQQMALPHASGLRVLPAPPTVLAASLVDDRVVSRILSLARRAYKYVVVDTFPVVDGVLMSVLDMSNIVCVITQVIVPVLNGTASLLETLDHLGLPDDRIWVVLNRAQASFAGELTTADVEAHLGVPVRREIAYDKRMPMSVNMGRPRVLHAPAWSRFRRSVNTLARELQETRPAELPASAPAVPEAAAERGAELRRSQPVGAVEGA